MFVRKNLDNNIKTGRITCFFKNNKDRVLHRLPHISLEWLLKFAPLNFNISFDGVERSYIFKFWFIWVFYLSFENIFKYYPKECVNSGYLNSATRNIGINQYDFYIKIYFWHDGECDDYDKNTRPKFFKDKKIFYKRVDLNLKDKIIGPYCYHTIEEDDFVHSLQLPEHKYKVKVHYRYWHLKYKRFPFLNRKGKSIMFKSKIKISENCKLGPFWVTLKDNQDITIAYNNYLKQILKHRMPNWIPLKYKKEYYRKLKLERILSDK
ncbi:hypothetical protein M0Q97_02560 [Candidatus Dojkabacteria bacterium]|jgi:hypothetical protein|nr:hypothetical protein [Candidatus Dojkabacteria bacterium]